jgi:hypothetical protein
MQWREVGRAAGGQAGGTGSIGRDEGRRGVRVGGAGLNGRVDDGGSDGQAGCTGSDERCGVSRAGGRGVRGVTGVRAHLSRLVGWTVEYR